MTGTRSYDVEFGPGRGGTHLDHTVLPLGGLGKGASRLSLEISIAGNRAKPAYVELTRSGTVWSVTRVRHG